METGFLIALTTALPLLIETRPTLMETALEMSAITPQWPYAELLQRKQVQAVTQPLRLITAPMIRIGIRLHSRNLRQSLIRWAIHW